MTFKKRLESLILAAAVTSTLACQNEPVPSVPLTTVEKAPVKSVPIEPLPEVDEEVQIVVSKNMNLSEAERKRIEAAAVAERVALPFAPAIAMDPVDGQKVSIRKNTPQFEYKKRIYYFTSEANRRAFISAPETYTKGNLAKYQ